MTNSRLSRLGDEVAFASRMLSLDGHDDFNQGQVSARLPGSTSFIIKSALVGFDEATRADVVTAHTDLREDVDRLAPPELPLHQAIYRARQDVNAIVHSHAPYTLLFGIYDLELRPISHDGARFDALPVFKLTSNTVLDIETGEAIADVLGDAEAVLLRNHGGVVTGKSIRHAAIFAQVLERACRLQLAAESIDQPYAWSNDKDVLLKREFIFADLSVRSYWDYAVRRVQRAFPESRDWTA